MSLKKVIFILILFSSCMIEAHAEISLTYLGAFRVPKGNYTTDSFIGNQYTNAQYQTMTYNPTNNSLFLSYVALQETYQKKIGEITIPAIINPLNVGADVTQLNTATVIQNIQDISGDTFDNILQNGNVPNDSEAYAQPGGMLVYGNELYGTVWSYFDASSGNGYRSHWKANKDWTSGFGFSGIHSVGVSPTSGSANGGFVGGYMCEVPDEYKSILGYPLLTGRTGGPIVGRSSYGPTLWGFDPDNFNYGTPATATMFIGYTSDHQTLGGYEDTPSLYYNRATGIKGILWPKGSDQILVFGNHGLGISFDANGVPIANTSGACTGLGTSYRSEAKTNAWLVANSPSGWKCGYSSLSSTDITNGKSCCFDPIDETDKTHNLSFTVGVGESGYGPGTADYTEARTNAWLVANSSSGYTCGEHSMSAGDISAGNACVFVGTGETAKGGSAYPTVYQVWQYDVDDLIAVKNATKQPYEITPAIFNFDLPLADPTKGKSIIGVGYDSTNQIVYIGQAFGDGNFPLIHAFSVGGTQAQTQKSFSGGSMPGGNLR